MQQDIFSFMDDKKQSKPSRVKLRREPCNKCRDGEYRNIKELNYFGSDLNKYINKECSKEMTTINIDCLQYKRTKKTLRIIESKHSNEKMKGTQKEALDVLAKYFRILNLEQDDIFFECYIVSADYPYEKARAHNLVTSETTVFNNQEDFKSFLEFKAKVEKG